MSNCNKQMTMTSLFKSTVDKTMVLINGQLDDAVWDLEMQGYTMPLSYKFIKKVRQKYPLVYIDPFVWESVDDADVVKCTMCGAYNAWQDVFNDNFCMDCWHDFYTECSNCDDVLKKLDAYTVNQEKHYCQDCWSVVREEVLT